MYNLDGYYPMAIIKGPLYSQGYKVYQRNTSAGCPYNYYTYSVFSSSADPDMVPALYNACGDSGGVYKGLTWGQSLADLIVNEYLATIGTPTPTPQYHNICQNNICTRVSGAGTDECSNVGGSCGGGGAGYICLNNVCTYVSSGAGYPDLQSCKNVCGVGGTPTPQPGGCTNCNLTDNYCIFGNCISKKNILYGGIGIILLMIATR